jgi:hypothetical protein
VKLFIDNCLPPRVAQGLDRLLEGEGSALHLRAKFDQDTPDAVWLSELGHEGGWHVLTLDRNILKRPHEASAYCAARVTTFFLAKQWASLKYWDQAWMLVRWMPLFLKCGARYQPGTALHIKRGVPGNEKKVRVLLEP